MSSKGTLTYLCGGVGFGHAYPKNMLSGYQSKNTICITRFQKKRVFQIFMQRSSSLLADVPVWQLQIKHKRGESVNVYFSRTDLFMTLYHAGWKNQRELEKE